MLAVQLHTWRSEPRLVEIDTPVRGPGEVLLRIDAAGLCHSDLHLTEWPEGTLPYTVPFTRGHCNVFECLAERTIALAQLARLREPDGGYNCYLRTRMKAVLGPCFHGR